MQIPIWEIDQSSPNRPSLGILFPNSGVRTWFLSQNFQNPEVFSNSQEFKNPNFLSFFFLSSCGFKFELLGIGLCLSPGIKTGGKKRGG